MKLSEIEALADAVYDPHSDDWDLHLAAAKLKQAMNPQTVKAMCQLIKQQNATLLLLNSPKSLDRRVAETAYKEAVEAFNKFCEVSDGERS